MREGIEEVKINEDLSALGHSWRYVRQGSYSQASWARRERAPNVSMHKACRSLQKARTESQEDKMNSLVSIVIPTRNEEGNVTGLLARLRTSLESAHLNYEAIVVDNSVDKTAELAQASGARVITGEMLGLGQAIIDGIEASQGDIIIVMDADLSHRPEDIPKLLKPILGEGCDMTIGSRYVKGGSNPGWSLRRRVVSRVACLLALSVTKVKDATSGFFAFRKSILEV